MVFAESSPTTVAFLAGAASAAALFAFYSSRQQTAAASSEDLVESYLGKRISTPHTAELLKSLTRDTKSVSKSALAPYSLPAEVKDSARRQLTDGELAAFKRDGFVVCKQWFSKEEVAVLKGVVESDHQIEDQKISVPDTEGRDAFASTSNMVLIVCIFMRVICILSIPRCPRL